MAADNETRTHHHPVVAATANYCTIVPEIELAIDGQTDKQRNKKQLTSLELYLSYTFMRVEYSWSPLACKSLHTGKDLVCRSNFQLSP